jgi:quinol monooxygenase YgiN
VFIERWQHMDDLEKHFQTPSSLDFGKKISELVKSTPTIEIYQSEAMQRH